VRFHLIDRIDAYEPAKSVRGRKLTSLSEEFWEEADGGPVMPSPLILEALCQAGTWLIMITTERRKRAALLSVGSVSFLGDVRPGDLVEIEGTVESMSDELAVLSGQAAVDGRLVMEAKDIMCALIDAADLEDLEDTARMQKLLTRAE
jgi:3-hydroxyacyl-[acyl-carrier-protein] dehydratase